MADFLKTGFSFFLIIKNWRISDLEVKNAYLFEHRVHGVPKTILNPRQKVIEKVLNSNISNLQERSIIELAKILERKIKSNQKEGRQNSVFLISSPRLQGGRH